jgi:hypothetical protein
MDHGWMDEPSISINQEYIMIMHLHSKLGEGRGADCRADKLEDSPIAHATIDKCWQLAAIASLGAALLSYQWRHASHVIWALFPPKPSIFFKKKKIFFRSMETCFTCLKRFFFKKKTFAVQLKIKNKCFIKDNCKT